MATSLCLSSPHGHTLAEVMQPAFAKPRALPASGFIHVRFLGRSCESGGVMHKYRRCPGAIQAGYSSVGRASACRCVQLSDGPSFDFGWPDLAWCKHFGLKAGQLSWRSFPLASKQSRSSQTGSPNLMSTLRNGALSHCLRPLGQPVLINNGWVKACKAHHEATV